MAYQNDGYKRSMKIQITKHPDNGSPDTIIIEDGQLAFTHSGITYISYAGNDDGFRRLTHTEADDGEWDNRLYAFKQYIQNKYSISDPGLYESITGLPYRIKALNISISISDVIGQQGYIYAYTSDSVPDTLTINVKGADNSNIIMTIVSGDKQSQNVQLTSSQGSNVIDLSSPTVSPYETLNATYSVSIVK